MIPSKAHPTTLKLQTDFEAYSMKLCIKFCIYNTKSLQLALSFQWLVITFKGKLHFFGILTDSSKTPTQDKNMDAFPSSVRSVGG